MLFGIICHFLLKLQLNILLVNSEDADIPVKMMQGLYELMHMLHYNGENNDLGHCNNSLVYIDALYVCT